MLSLLASLFIKDKDNVKNPEVREKYGILCGGYGIFLNILLFVGKYIAGVLTSSISMTADAFNNLSDAGSSLISMLGFKLAGKKPDPEHPFGHGRMEYLAGLIVAGLILIMGYELTVDSVRKIVNPEETVFSLLAIIILALSILVKIYMSVYSRRIGRKIESETLLATATDSLSDTISTGVVLLASVINHFFNIKLDGWCGLFVGILILSAGVKTGMDTIKPLLGTSPSEELVKGIEEIVMSHEEIVGIHDLIVHDYGPGRLMITLHAEVPDNGDIRELHDVIDNTETELKTQLNCHATIHMDPVCVGDEYVDSLKETVREIVCNTEGLINFHDFRVVKGPTHTNLIFDVVASYSLKDSDMEICHKLEEAVRTKLGENNVYTVITVDRDYTGK